jgi:hypothetical protein
MSVYRVKMASCNLASLRVRSLDGPPQHFSCLTIDEQSQYQKLSQDVESIFRSNPKATKISDNFQTALDAIQRFVVSDDPAATQRKSLVCGIMWIGSVIAINTKQLCVLLHKCKSTVNNGFQAIGCKKVLADAETVSVLVHAFPFLKSDLGENRQWTFRSIAGMAATEEVELADLEWKRIGPCECPPYEWEIEGGSMQVDQFSEFVEFDKFGDKFHILDDVWRSLCDT